jgi:hypothetical protein
MWVKLGAGTSTCRERRRNGDIRRVTVLTHARTALVGVGLRKRRHFVCEVDIGECATTTVAVSHDTVWIKVAIKFVFADSSSDTEEQENYNGDTADPTNDSAHNDSDVRVAAAAGGCADGGGDDSRSGGSNKDD